MAPVYYTKFLVQAKYLTGLNIVFRDYFSPFVTVRKKFHNGYDKGNHTGNNEGGSMSSKTSTPYSQVSVPSSYDYEDDFTSDEEDSDASIVNGKVNNSK